MQRLYKFASSLLLDLALWLGKELWLEKELLWD